MKACLQLTALSPASQDNKPIRWSRSQGRVPLRCERQSGGGRDELIVGKCLGSVFVSWLFNEDRIINAFVEYDL